jgi:hypothetical protein
MHSLLDSNFFHYIFLPLLSLVSGFVCLYIDPKKSDKTAIVVILVLAASAIATGASGFLDDQKGQLKEQAAQKEGEEQLSRLTATQQDVHFLIALLQTSKGGALAAAKPSEIDHNRVQQSLAATVAISQKPESEKPAAERPEIEYFTKDVDREVVTNALQEAGFRFAKKVPVLKDQPTSSIWVGDPVAISDLKLVALTLVRAGVQIHSIQRFRLNSPRRTKLVVQVGSYPAMETEPAWTVDRIQNLTELPARDSGSGLGN